MSASLDKNKNTRTPPDILSLVKRDVPDTSASSKKQINKLPQHRPGDSQVNPPTEERLFSIRVHTIIDELTQIMDFIAELERFWLENFEVTRQIDSILIKLRSGDASYKYTRIVHILTKYMNGIRDVSSDAGAKNIIFYKKLIESTLVAIIRELDYIEE